MAVDPLDDFSCSSFTNEGSTKPVYRLGSGPAVIVMSEVPGITPKVADFSRRLVDHEMTVFMPDLFGSAGKERSTPYVLDTLVRNCVSKEFSAFATESTSPVTTWLRALAAHAHKECGGPGVGAIGMCWTGGFALGMMVDDVVVAPALSQPSLPLPISKSRRSDLGISAADLNAVKQRAADGVCVMGMRFTGDSLVPGERFARLRDELGDNFIGVEIDSTKGNEHGIGPMAHSVVTEDLVDEPGHPTRKALDELIEFFRSRLDLS